MSTARWVVRVAIGCVLVMPAAASLAADPLTSAEQARYADLDARPLQSFTNMDVADYLALRQRYLAVRGELPDPAEEVGRYAVKALGQPYRLYASRFDYAESDCVVFVERCLAMGLSGDWTTYRKLSDRLRHRDGVVGYVNRNFLTLEDWVPSNGFLLRDASGDVGSHSGPLTRGFTCVVRPKVFRDVPPDPVTGVATEFVGVDYASPNKLMRTEVYIPRDRLGEALPDLRTGDVALVIRQWIAPGKKPWYDCDHMGIVIRGSGGTVAMAHSAPNRARLERLDAFLAQYLSVSGFKILRLVPDSRDVVQREIKRLGAGLSAPSAMAEDSVVEAARRARADADHVKE
ncbi:MAG: N-acetylmuramoyl-L-alanine amidase-like domain-containing protein [Phycisphaerae bacterium]